VNQILYICDFVPGNTGGGALLMERLLSAYPARVVTILCGSDSFRRTAGEHGTKLKNECLVLPIFSRRGRWGIGRLRSALDWLAIPFVAVTATRAIRKKRVAVMLSIAHGRFFIAASLAARIQRIPLLLWVHDDWVALTRSNSFLLKYIARSVFGFAVRSASHVYAVSEPMARWLRSEFNVEATIQLPAGELPRDVLAPTSDGRPSVPGVVRIAFAGTCVAADETLKMLARVTRTNGGLPDGRRLELHLYMPRPADDPVWQHERIIFHSWMSQTALKAELRAATILFLPYNFSEADGFVPARSFPTKASDYMCSGTPMLVMAPEFSAIVRYARDNGFAEIVSEPREDLLVDAIWRLASDTHCQAALATRALEVFLANHEIGTQRQQVSLMIERLAGSQA
jgi:hypothetical protein